jgi:uncharacterized protein (TIGR00369 family)
VTEEARRPWEDEQPEQPHVWRTLGYRRVRQGGGESVLEWEAPPEYAFPAPSGPIIHGGLVATLLDTAMGGACWSTLDDGETFLTADLHVEFLRSSRPGTLRAEGKVVHRTKRVVFCSGDLYDETGQHLASARCTQVLRSRR